MIEYTFIFDKETKVEFAVEQEGGLGISGHMDDDGIPSWAKLETFRCRNCTLPGESVKVCPAAMSIMPVVKSFNTRVSFETVQVVVKINDVRLEATTSTQNAVRSLVGLLLALSDCPVMMKLRPMAQFHLPFGDREHTVFRTLGMYLIAQRLRSLNGMAPDWDLSGLLELYKKIHEVNDRLADRIRAASEEDATVNSLVILDVFGFAVEKSVEKNLQKLEPLFKMYLEED